MSKTNAQYVTEHRIKVKKKAIDAFGGKCGICGYDKCKAALEFHHVDPHEKDFGVSHKGVTLAWSKMAAELRKCICLCSNCHREVHAGLTEIPNDIQRFDESHAEWTPAVEAVVKTCVECGKGYTGANKNFCSRKCRTTNRIKNTRYPPLEELKKMVKQKGYRKVGEMFGVSDNSIRKYIKTREPDFSKKEK